MIKIKLQTLNDAADCPFYVEGPKKINFVLSSKIFQLLKQLA